MGRIPLLPLLPEMADDSGHGVALRRWRVADAQALAHAVTESAEHLRPWMVWMAREPMSLEQRRAMLERSERDWRGGGDVMMAILKGDAVAGSCGLHRRRGPGTLEIGYWVHPAFLRQGLASITARLLTDAAFTVPGIGHVEIHHDKANVASAGIPRRLGFELVGEEPDDPPLAPAESGIECTWRMSRAPWLARHE